MCDRVLYVGFDNMLQCLDFNWSPLNPTYVPFTIFSGVSCTWLIPGALPYYLKGLERFRLVQQMFYNFLVFVLLLENRQSRETKYVPCYELRTVLVSLSSLRSSEKYSTHLWKILFLLLSMLTFRHTQFF